MRRALAGFREQHGWGRALAAPQLGIGERAIVLRTGEWDIALLNPTITWRSAEQILVWDDCFSLPSITAPVLRHASISLLYQDEDGRDRRLDQVPSDLAELLQHEVDHLDGILFVDRAIASSHIVAREHQASAAAAYAQALQANLAAEPEGPPRPVIP
jgi:peptide deformylase